MIGLQRLQQLFDTLATDEYVVDVDVRRVTDADNAFETLMHVDAKDESDKRILMDLPTKDCEDILLRQVTDNFFVRPGLLLLHGYVNICGTLYLPYQKSFQKKLESQNTILPTVHVNICPA